MREDGISAPESGGLPAAEEWLQEQFAQLTQAPSQKLEDLVRSLAAPRPVADSRTQCRFHLIARDANDAVQTGALSRLLATQLVNYCIPRTRVQAAADHFAATRSMEQVLGLQAEAKELFTSLKKSGEGGELLLYMLLERVLGLPQLLCKMPLKTSAKMHVHGTDGIHGQVLPNGNLALYWGESKLYGDVNKAIDDCFASLAPFLTDEDGEVQRRDLLLLRDHVDTLDPLLTEALRRFVLEDAPESSAVEFRGACLIGFSASDYPRADSEAITEAVQRWYERIGTQINTHKLARAEIEVFCLPFPSVQAFRDSVHTRLGIR